MKKEKRKIKGKLDATLKLLGSKVHLTGNINETLIIVNLFYLLEFLTHFVGYLSN